jgi:hypothetical protein
MEKDFINILQDIKNKAYDFNGYDVKEILNQSLAMIGDQNPKVRDDLVYPVLAHLFHDKHLSEQDLESNLDVLLSDDYLFYDMHNEKLYSALKRSFTVLQLVIICYVHRKDHVISQEKINHLLERFLSYYIHEDILTGYDPKVGWIHTIAHSADLFHQLVQVEHFLETDIMSMLDAIQIKMMNKQHDFVFNEDERTVVAVKKVLESNKVNQDKILSWIDGFLIKDKTMVYLDLINLENNIKRLLRSLYFSVYKDEKYQEVVKHIEIVLTENQKR